VIYIYLKMSDTQDITDEKVLCETKPYRHIKLTDKGMLIYDGWSNERLLSLLKDKLIQHNNIKSLSVCTSVQCNTLHDKSLHFIIHNGIYNDCILLKLEGKGCDFFRENFCAHIFHYLEFITLNSKF